MCNDINAYPVTCNISHTSCADDVAADQTAHPSITLSADE